MKTYKHYYQRSIDAPEDFWKEQASNIDWITPPQTILGESSNGIYEWFADGELNMSYLCLDKHINDGNGGRVALYYDSPATGSKNSFTYQQLYEKVTTFAGVLHKLGVEKGDTVIIYMPMVPEAVVAMLACARLGAIHSVVFGGFAPHELQVRIDDCKPKVILSASCGIEFTKIINYKNLVDEAIKLSEHKPQSMVYLARAELKIELTNPNEYDWHTLTSQATPYTDYATMKGNDLIYILYTSGTTAKPKGVVRQVGGHAVSMYFSMKYVYNCEPGDTYWAASDIGWVVGHSYIVYAPLVYGCSTVFYEGKPIRTPDPGAFWRVISEYNVKAFFTAPTAFRAIKKEDPSAEHFEKYDTSCLEAIFVAGERLDPPTLQWLTENTKKPVYDHWWQTETGYAIVANPLGVEPKPIKQGSSTLPAPGYQIDILDEDGSILPTNKEGYIGIKLPMPPGCLNTLWAGFDDFHRSYLSKFEGYYLTGDGGYKDDDGYVFIMGRVDDVINVSGHRLSTGEMEEIVGTHTAVAECAVIGIKDELKGEVPLGFFVTKDDCTASAEKIEAELIALVREQIGAVAVFKKAIRVDRLPKTRSGKILRKSMRELSEKDDIKMPSTIDDPTILDEIREKLRSNNIGVQSN